MPRYVVQVEYTVTESMSVWAVDEKGAMEKAEEKIKQCRDTQDVKAIACKREDS